ncbi:mitogen-activated protein kinase kinase kinase 14 [Elysia marginata]|uniref:Mitogen-activated protein kinase kinase kinase 14 n=1 Tax=Elysia marginata TaxID=1093978 RepID=A0AAV4H9X3_9GAST|nr:mitogen-activated protein kinase kinase kinase 14 [Elysia marginata]
MVREWGWAFLATQWRERVITSKSNISKLSIVTFLLFLSECRIKFPVQLTILLLNMAGALPQREEKKCFDFFQATVQLKPGSKNPFEYLPPKYANTEQNVIYTKSRNSQIEAVLETIDIARRENKPSGLVLNPEQVSAENPPPYENMIAIKRVLGEGNSAGKVFVVQDASTGKDCAVKTVLISHFSKDEIRSWVHLGDTGKAPELYSFKLHGNQVVMRAEIVEGKTLKEVFASEGFQKLLTDEGKSDQKKCFALLLLRGLLDNFNLLKKGNFTHGDLHGGNVMVSPTLEMKLIDFGSAKGMRPDDGINHAHRLKADIVSILRHFCHAYTGYDFNQQSDAQKVLTLQTYREVE